MQHAPIHRDFPCSDAKESTKIDDGGPHHAGMVDHHVDDAPHVIAGGTLHRLAEKCVGCATVDDDGWRFGIAWLSRSRCDRRAAGASRLRRGGW